MWQVGMPVGVMYGADLIGIAVFQLMIAQASVPGAAATQIIITITSLAYQPAIGIATAGTTFVGQAIGAGRYELARRYGNRAIALCVAWMGCAAVFLLLAGAAIARFFLGADDAAAQAALAIALQILWPAAAYQVFDGLYFGAGFALRAAGDTRVPAVAALVLSWFVFVPLAHALIFTPQQAWFGGLPQFGWGAFGGWIALMSYAIVLGSLIFVRWRLGAWRRLVRL
ncbi:MAG: MATE family efflux transporter [Steroidobacteraceae bacterium]|nr:MATE family efflux transporter [Steroidobacteraceae bacterium]MDW8259737.1 MATE family efflux transporter [Gammaproteobacteria bacterium]